MFLHIYQDNHMKKQKVNFVATRYKDNPAKIDYYTEDGRVVAKEMVEVKQEGSRKSLYCYVQ
jgi:hypothetical protein